MNSFNRRLFYVFSFLAIILVLSSCGNDFLNVKQTDAVSPNNFYKTDKQVNASTNVLYGTPWFQFNDALMWNVGEVLSGNGRMFNGVPHRPFYNFTLTGTNKNLTQGWKSLWSIVAQCNGLINNLKTNAGAEVDKATLNQALGEAHIIRAVAYYYLVRIWGPVPIIENNLDYVYSPQVPRNYVKDVYQFISNDLNFGIDHCKQEIRGSNYADNAHASSGTAKALLSSVYLTQGNYQKAQELSQQVIDSGEFHLLSDYANLFKTANNNNPESILQMQWHATGWGRSNARVFFYAISSKVTGVAGWASVGPTINLQNAYSQEDKRRKPTIMLAGDHYSDILASQGGYTVPQSVNVQGTRAGVKKYVPGTPDDNGGLGDANGFPNNTYIMRYAQVLLINAEAAYRNGNTLQALTSINKVRERAGLSDFTNLTLDKILNCRRLELAFEDQYWFTLKRIDRSKAINMISNQERGYYSQDSNGNWTVVSQKFTPSNDDFALPYPSVDVEVNKYLTQPPQPYNFNK